MKVVSLECQSLFTIFDLRWNNPIWRVSEISPKKTDDDLFN